LRLRTNFIDILYEINLGIFKIEKLELEIITQVTSGHKEIILSRVILLISMRRRKWLVYFKRHFFFIGKVFYHLGCEVGFKKAIKMIKKFIHREVYPNWNSDILLVEETKMKKYSAGILLFRFKNKKLEVMLVHPGGPFWARKDDGVWSIPKGLFEGNENPLDAARREFKEETGFEADGEFIELGEIQQPSKKIIHAWALEKDLDVTKIMSNKFTLEWPKNSGKVQEYPEIDKAGWFDIEQAKKKIIKGQIGFINKLIEIINSGYMQNGS